MAKNVFLYNQTFCVFENVKFFSVGKLSEFCHSLLFTELHLMHEINIQCHMGQDSDIQHYLMLDSGIHHHSMAAGSGGQCVGSMIRN